LNRVLQDGKVRPVGSTKEMGIDVRVVAATNRMDIFSASDTGFRLDLLARLEDMVICLPPLRERKEDIIPIIVATARSMGFEPMNFAADLVECSLIYPWPRNVRQLVRFFEAVVCHVGHDDLVSVDSLTARGVPCPDRLLSAVERGGQVASHFRCREGVASTRKTQLDEALARNGGNLTAAAKELGVSRQHAYRLRRLDGMHRRPFLPE